MATYVVRSGDTLSGIGQKFGVPYSQITGYRSGNPNLIYPGEVLNVPDKTPASTPTPTPAPAPAPTPAAVPAAVQSPANTAQQIIDIAAQNQKKAAEAFTNYRSSNPFSFDEYLKGAATSMAKEQADPYYNESLSNYLLGVSRKQTRSISDTQDLIGELQASSKSFTENTKLALDEAINKSRQGFADTGLFESGARYRDEGLATRQAGDTLATNERQTALKEKGYSTDLSRTLEDLSLGKTMDVRNLERSRATDVGITAAQLAKEKGQQYVSGFMQTLPPELQANTNFDLLKQIGVYS